MRINDASIDKVLKMGHCGIVAAFADRMGIVEFLDSRLPKPAGGGASFGQIAKGLIIQLLNSRLVSLQLSPEAFEALPTEDLLGPGVLPEHFVDEKIGELLHAIGEYGAGSLYGEFAEERLRPLLPEQVNLHGAVANFILRPDMYGVFLEVVTSEEACEEVEEFAFSMRSEPLRYNCKMAVDGSGVPLCVFFMINECDFKKPSYYAGTLDLAAKTLSSSKDGMLFGMADVAFYTSARLQDIGYAWFARVPDKVEEAARLMDTNDALLPSSDPDLSLLEKVVPSFDTEQRFILFESRSAAEKQAEKSMDRIMEKKLRDIRKEAAKLCKVDFPSEEEALAASDDFFSIHPEVEGAFRANAVLKRRKTQRGSDDSETVYRLECELNLHEYSEEMIRGKLGRFVLATNTVGPDAPSAEAILDLYKRQWRFPRGMRFLSGRELVIYGKCCLETREQIHGTVFLLILTLALYNFGESELRRVLAQSGEDLLDYKGTAVKSPGLGNLFDVFGRVLMVHATDGDKSVVSLQGLTEHARRILSLLGEGFERYYAVDPETSDLTNEIMLKMVRSWVPSGENTSQ